MKVHVFPAAGVVAGVLAIAIAVGALEFSSGRACAAQFKPPEVSFKEDVFPILQFHCSSCHRPDGEGYQKSGFDVSSYDTVMKGTKFGPMIVPGDPGASNLMRLLDWGVGTEIRMPHGQKQLTICDRDLIRTWIFKGAKDN